MHNSSQDLLAPFRTTLEEIKEAGLYKSERIIKSSQNVEITVNDKTVLNFCANNYLGLADDPRIKAAAIKGIETYGFGLASVRFICGTQTIHKQLEQAIASFLGTEDTILYSSCFDANGGLFETILTEEDAIISDALNHASIIDGIRLCKAKRFRYANGDLDELETHLKTARQEGAKKILIATDGVFSMDGYVAKLDAIVALAEQYGALTMVDECHATGFFGATGRGSIEHCNVMGKIDIITSTLGKALGGASGGFTTGRKPIIDLLRQRSRPYLFSNSLAPAIVTASLACLDILQESSAAIDTLKENTRYFRAGLTEAGFTIKPGIHPIIPVMIGDAKKASEFADALLQEGIYVVGFSFPVVPKGQARIRTQMSAAHTKEQLDKALASFIKVRNTIGL
jgi:glycine C-acetyltransferase